MCYSCWVLLLLLFLLQAHVVSAFEQSLSNMTHRLQQLAANTDQKVWASHFRASDQSETISDPAFLFLSGSESEMGNTLYGIYNNGEMVGHVKTADRIISQLREVLYRHWNALVFCCIIYRNILNWKTLQLLF